MAKPVAGFNVTHFTSEKGTRSNTAYIVCDDGTVWATGLTNPPIKWLRQAAIPGTPAWEAEQASHEPK